MACWNGDPTSSPRHGADSPVVRSVQTPRRRHRVEGSADRQRRRRQHRCRTREHPVAQQAGDRQRRHPQYRARRTPVVLVIQPDHVGAIGDRRGERRQDPRRGIRYLAQRRDRFGARRRGLGVAGGVDRRPCRAGRVAQRGEVCRHLVVEVIDAARRGVMDRRGEVGRAPPPAAGSVPGSPIG